MKIKIIALFLFAGVISSCEKFLDVKPVGKLIPTEVEEFDNLLNNTKTVNYNFMDNSDASALVGFSDNVYMSDEVVKYAYNKQTQSLHNFATYIFNPPYMNFTQPDLYLDYGIYGQLGVFNNVIDGVRDIEGENSSQYGREVIAQAMVGRAWTLLHGVITYGPMYDKSGSNDTRVLPYRTESDPSISSPDLSTTEEVFNLAASDLQYAIENCPNRVINPSRASKTAAHAVMAQLHMYKADYEKMYEQAKKAWDLQVQYVGGDANLFYDYNEFKYEVKSVDVENGADERTKLKIITPDNLHFKTYSKENLFYRQSGYYTSYTRPNQEYLDLFTDGDMREELFIMNDVGYRQTFSGMGPGGTDLEINESIGLYDVRHSKRTGVPYKEDYHKLLPNLGITNPALLLMYAEAAARTGKHNEALTLLNRFRKFRYKAENAELNGVTGDDLILEIINERRKELPLSSPFRFWDMKRFAFEDGKPWAKKSITRTVMGETMTIDITSDKYQLEMSNAYRKSNPHWGLPVITGTYDPYKYASPF